MFSKIDALILAFICICFTCLVFYNYYLKITKVNRDLQRKVKQLESYIKLNRKYYR